MALAESTLVERVNDIVELEEPILRNLLITQCYHDLARGLGGLFGSENANWCTFATWASKTAGRFIRKDDVPVRLRKLLKSDHGAEGAPLSGSFDLFGPPTEDDGWKLLELPDHILEDVSDLIARGNLKVFSELGPVFARMITIYQGRERPDAEMLAELLEPLVPGASYDGGQDLLRSALTQYHAAMLAEDPDAKAELVLLGNGRIGLHEQTRLQPYIAGSLNAPMRAVTKALPATSGRISKTIESAIYERVVRPAVERVESLWRELATKGMMRLSLPSGEILNLGEDVTPLPGQPLYPCYLDTIEDAELRGMLQEYGAHDSTSLGSGASDWASLQERMAYILELFRSRQRDECMRAPPFASEQHTEILAGRIPDGDL
jgi:hypothetical protein